jgi:malonyl-CoA O-methyltransferase
MPDEPAAGSSPVSPTSGDAPASRAIDSVAVDAIQRRMARAAEAPWLHGEVARRMAERLPIIKLQPAALLDWSGACGASEALLAQAYPKARRMAVEPNAAVAQQRRQARKPAWWSFMRPGGQAASVLAPQEVEPGSAELLWSNMMLHAAIDPPVLLAQWQRALKVDGFVMFSCLGPDTVRELRDVYAALGWGPPSADFVDMHDIGDMMVHAGFADPVMDQETLTLTWSTPEALLAELHALGGNTSPRRFQGLRGRAWQARLMNELRSRAQPDGRIALRFEVAYGHAFKPLPKPRVQREATISVDEMRAMIRSSAPTTRQP